MNEDISNYYHFYDKKLGEGGFAKVTLATHIATRQNVAIKCLDKVKLGPELPRIYNEIECLKRLKHKNIARLYQVFETQTIIYLVLEYCSGGELFDYIVKKSKLNEPESAQILFDLMRVLDFIHLNGFAHRDLKPENLLFDDKHQIKLIDFGLAANCSAEHLAANKTQAPIDQLHTCCGSVTYAAPEVISGSVYSGTAVDVWSAGVMMYALLVGQLPFNDNSIAKLYQKIQGGIKNLPTYLSPEASDLIRKMLTVDPKQRITVKEVLAHPWLRTRTIHHTRINRRLDFRSGQLDEQIVKRCCEIFTQLSETQLRQYIQLDFNYYSTAYHLLLARCPPRSLMVISPPGTAKNQQQKLQSITNNDGQPKQPQQQLCSVSPNKRLYNTLGAEPARKRAPPAPVVVKRLYNGYVTPPNPKNQRQQQQQQSTMDEERENTVSINRKIYHTFGTEPRKKAPVVRRLYNGYLTPQNTAHRQPQPTLEEERENTVAVNKKIYYTFGTEPRKKVSVVKRLIGSATPSKLKKFYCRNR